MPTVAYVCKYTPIELLQAMGAQVHLIDSLRDSFDNAEVSVGPSVCGFGKAVLEAAYAGEFDELVLVTCCDTIRCVADILRQWGGLKFLYCLDLPHCADSCAREKMALELRNLAQSYSDYAGVKLEETTFRTILQKSLESNGEQQALKTNPEGSYVGVIGARMADEEFKAIADELPLPARNLTCVHARELGTTGSQMPLEDANLDELLNWYAAELLGQIPCMRMMNIQGRRQLLADPHLAGIVYHTVKFCDFYGFEYAELKDETSLPLVKVESDFTRQATAQMGVRIGAFAEELNNSFIHENHQTVNESFKDQPIMSSMYYAGIDSGSTSTDVVIVDASGSIVATSIVHTGSGAKKSAEAALSQALDQAGISHNQIAGVVTTGYGRETIKNGAQTQAITEITCHAKGARFLDPQVNTVIDIGGQDSKVIRLDEHGNVAAFAMNDKCAAGTGRFLEMMARTLELDLDEMAQRGLNYTESITISSTCSVFAESEVVGLIAQDKNTDDIVHGLNESVASRTCGLVRRANGKPPYVMTGGVSRNRGVVAALSRQLGSPVHVPDNAQLAGALGAALIAAEL